MSTSRGPPKHQNQYAWKPKAGVKINETEVGGRFRPLSEVTGVCPRCRDQINWKRRYGKYKTLIEPAKCQGCSKRNVRQAYHNLCTGCAKEQKVCAKCRSHVERTVGKDLSEVEAEQKLLEETIKNARERDRRTLLRAMNKEQEAKKNAEKPQALTEENKVGDLFPATSLEEYAKSGKVAGATYKDHNDGPNSGAFHDSDSYYDEDDIEDDDVVEDDGEDTDRVQT